MQLDTEDGETFVPPAGVVASPTSQAADPTTERPQSQGSNHADIRAAAEAAREMEE